MDWLCLAAAEVIEPCLGPSVSVRGLIDGDGPRRSARTILSLAFRHLRDLVAAHARAIPQCASSQFLPERGPSRLWGDASRHQLFSNFLAEFSHHSRLGK